MMNLGITDDEILQLLERDDISIIDGAYGDELDETLVYSDTNVIDIMENEDDENSEYEEEINYDEIENVICNNKPENGTNQTLRVQRFTKKKKIKWKKCKSFVTQPINWRVPHQEEIFHLQKPVDFFSQYITNNLLKTMVEMTNLYAVQKNVTFMPTNIQEIKILLGIHILMGNLNLPRVRMYWEPHYGIGIIKENMTLKRFFKLRNMLHFVDVTARQGNADRIWKVRPIYDEIRKRCLSLHLQTNLCVDEQIVPFKGSLNIKQYIKNKPKRWG